MKIHSTTEHDRLIYLKRLKKLYKVKYHSILNRLSYERIRRMYSATKIVEVE